MNPPCARPSPPLAGAECFVEQFLDKPAIEAQVLADTHGNVVVLEHARLLAAAAQPEAGGRGPAPFLSDAQRERIHTAARDICAAAGLRERRHGGVLLSQSGAISFLEVNTRPQVEHP